MIANLSAAPVFSWLLGRSSFRSSNTGETHLRQRDARNASTDAVVLGDVSEKNVGGLVRRADGSRIFECEREGKK